MTKWIYPCLLLFSQSLLAMPDIDEYAYKAEISPAKQKLQRLDLPMAVLLNLTSSRLDDIRVFDSEEKVLPISVRKKKPEELKESIDLNFHIFNHYRKQHSRVITTREQNDRGGLVSELQTTETIDSPELGIDYLIELPDKPQVTELELEWIQQPTNQLLQVKLEAGNDLDNLRTIDSQKVLSNINSATPEWRFIKNIPQSLKYLRITPTDKIESFELLRVSGHYRQTLPLENLWHRVEFSPIEIDDRSYLAFQSPTPVPANSLRIKPAEPHSIISGTLYASNIGFEQKQRMVATFRQHNITGNGIQPSQPVSLPNRSFHYWWIELEQQSVINPQLELAYPVYELMFLGSDNHPFTLAWGNYQSEMQKRSLADLLGSGFNKDENRGTEVGLNTTQPSGGKSRLTPEAELPWKKWLLWVALAIAVLVTGRMAYGLYREMNL